MPLLHRFPKGTTPRIYYAALLGAFGIGAHKNGKSVVQWAADFCTWLDLWTHYRSATEIHRTFARYFGHTTHREELWFDACFANHGTFLAAALRRFIVRNLAGMVLISRRPHPC